MNRVFSEHVKFFADLISCGQDLRLWAYDPDMSFLACTGDSPETFNTLLALDGCLDCLKECAAQGGGKPMILYSPIGCSWIAAFEQAEGMVYRVYLLGPAFNSDRSHRSTLYSSSCPGYPQALLDLLREQIRTLPVIPLSSWMQYGLMLHFCLNGEKLEISDFSTPVEFQAASEREEDTGDQIPGEGAWLAEQAALQMIENGDLNYQKTFSQLSMYSSFTVPEGTRDELRHFQNSVISFMTLCSQAALRGGLDYRIVYYLTEQYTSQVESCGSISDLIRINSTMYEDFVKRVHKLKSSSPLSRGIQICCNYIEMHLSEKISLAELARAAGYSENHLSAKFKKETGQSISDYIRDARIRQAKVLLRSTSQSVSSIAESLGFSSSSYFARTFHDLTGLTPAVYRNNSP